MTSPLYLSRNVSFCDCDGAVVFLSAATDTYLRLAPDQTDWFHQIRSGLTASSPEPVRRFALALIRSNILTQDAKAGRRLAPEPPGQPLRGQVTLPQQDAAVRPSHLLKLLYSAAVCTRLERSKDIAGVLDTARQWKQAAASRKAPVKPALNELAAVFHSLCPLVFSSRDECRYRSLTLLRFATLYGFSPDWVFGVRLSPFQAHCWLEADGYVLNDDPGNIREFRRILTI